MKSHRIIYEVIDYINDNAGGVLILPPGLEVDEYIIYYRVTEKNKISKMYDIQFYTDRVFIDPLYPERVLNLYYKFNPQVLDLLNLLVDKNATLHSPVENPHINETRQNIILRLL